jgi:hypothetical protein
MHQPALGYYDTGNLGSVYTPRTPPPLGLEEEVHCQEHKNALIV